MAQKVLRPEQYMVLGGRPCSACTKDIKLEKKIKELEIQIKKIHIKRRTLHTAMNENHDPLIYKFPPEIASHIFVECSPLIERFDIPYRVDPFYLSMVCQKWQQLAWETPELWTSLNIGSYDQDQVQLVREWLDRSGGLPLSIKLVDNGEHEDQPEEHHDRVINLLNKRSARWHDMNLRISEDHLCCLFSVGSSSASPTLSMALPSFQHLG